QPQEGCQPAQPRGPKGGRHCQANEREAEQEHGGESCARLQRTWNLFKASPGEEPSAAQGQRKELVMWSPPKVYEESPEQGSIAQTEKQTDTDRRSPIFSRGGRGSRHGQILS